MMHPIEGFVVVLIVLVVVPILFYKDKDYCLEEVLQNCHLCSIGALCWSIRVQETVGFVNLS